MNLNINIPNSYQNINLNKPNNKAIVLLQIFLELLAIVGYVVGIIPKQYYQYGWITIISLGVIALVCNQLTMSEKILSITNLAMAVLVFVPIFGWLFIIYGIKLSIEHIQKLIVQLRFKSITTETKQTPTPNPFEPSKNTPKSSDSKIEKVDVEIL